MENTVRVHISAGSNRLDQICHQQLASRGNLFAGKRAFAASTLALRSTDQRAYIEDGDGVPALQE
jgi:hypothetical protein